MKHATRCGLTAGLLALTASLCAQNPPAPQSVAVLPFCAPVAAELPLAEKMRFAVSQKISRDRRWNRLDNVQVEHICEGIPLSPQSLPDEAQWTALFGALKTQVLIAGEVKNHKLALIYRDTTGPSRRVEALLPPDQETPRPVVEKLLKELLNLEIRQIRDVEVDHQNPLVEQRWKERPNLVIDGGFEAAAGSLDGLAKDWEAILRDKAYPPRWVAKEVAALPADSVSIVPRSASGDKTGGACLMLRVGKEVAESNGLACQSDWIAVENGKRYRVSALYHSTAPTLRVFIKGFALHADQFSDPARAVTQRREYYRAQVLPRAKNGALETLEMDFTPEPLDARFPIQWVRIDFYTYLKAGDVFVDQVVLKKISE